MSDFSRLVLIALFVLGNAVFVAAEYALVTASRPRLQERAEKGSRGARRALALMDTPVTFISTVQVAITVFSIGMGAIGQPLLTDYFDPIVATTIAYAVSFLILTYVSVTLGELVPKSIALEKAEPLAIFLAYPTSLLALVARPLVLLLQVSANAVTRLFGVESSASGMFARTREDVRLIVTEAGESGVIEGVEHEMLYGAFKFAGKEVHDVMVPRPEVVAISVDLPPEECLSAVIDSPYTRYPAYRNSLDEILGVLHVRDLFSALYSRGIENVEIERLLRKPYVVPETKDLAALLAEFRRTNQHMAIVVDEYGSMEGIVTLEDLLEEIVGEIEDEYDLPDESIERVDDKTVRVDGTFPIDDFNEAFSTAIPVEDYHTIGGFVFGLLGRAPEAGDTADWDGVNFQVLDVEGSRIDRLIVVFERPNEEPKAEVASGG
jgi:putative hemolysin